MHVGVYHLQLKKYPNFWKDWQLELHLINLFHDGVDKRIFQKKIVQYVLEIVV